MKTTSLLLAGAGLCAVMQIATAEDKRIHFEIPALPAADALDALAAQSELQMLFDRNALQNSRTQALSGTYTPREALQKLLAGSGLTFTFTAQDAVAVKPGDLHNQADPSLLPTVKVVGQQVYDALDPFNPDYKRPNASTATKTDTPIMETPLAIQVVPQQVMEDQQAYRLDRVLNNVSGVFSQPINSGGGTNESTVIRGFNTSTTYRNGMLIQGNTMATGPVETAQMDRIEVLKGPASMLYGRIEPGGIINLVTKSPLATPYYSLQQQFGSYNLYRTTADATGPITKDDSLLYRLNFAYEDAGSFQEFRQNNHVFVAPTLRWNISPRTQVNFELEYKDAQDPVDNGIPVIPGTTRPAAMSRRFNPNDPNNVNNSQHLLAGFNWSHAFNDDWTLRHSFLWNQSDMSQRTTGVFGVGAYGAGPHDLDRYNAIGGINANAYNTMVNLTGKFQTWGLAHTLLLGGDYYTVDQKNPVKADFASFLNLDAGIRSDLGLGLTGITIQQADYRSNEDWYGFYLQDQVKLPYGFQALAGFRYDHATAQYATTDILNGPSFDFDNRSDDDAVTPRFGMLWQPIPQLSFYGNYVENFGGPNMTNRLGVGTPSPLKPQTAQQWEVGIKTELFDKRLTGTLAWFDLTKQNLPAADPHTLRTVLVGEARNRGLEADIAGEILPGWRMIAAGAYIDSAIIKDSQLGQDAGGNTITTPGDTGHRLYNVPRFSGSLWSTYEWEEGYLKGLKLGGGAVARSQRQGDNANSFQLPGYALLNLMAGYQMKVGPTKVGLQFNIDNLLDKDYFQSSAGYYSSGAYFGAPRTFLGSVRIEY